MKENKKTLLISALLMSGMAASAQEFGAEYVSEIQTNFKKEVNWADMIRLDASLPLWKKGSFEYASYHIFSVPNRPVINDWQGYSNINYDNMAFNLAVFGYTHEFSESFSMFAGIRNVDEDYFSSEHTPLFTNASCGIFPTVSANYGVGTYPLSAMGIHARLNIGQNWTLQGSLYNGMARPAFGDGHGIFDIRPEDDGFIYISDVSYEQKSSLPGTYYGGFTIGNKIHSTDENDEAVTETKANFAYWLYASQDLWRSGDSSLGMLAQFSQNISVEQGCKRYYALGLTLNNFIVKSMENSFGIYCIKSDFDNGDEDVVELTYRLKLNDYIEIQPAYQFIKNTEDTYNVAMMRLCIGF